MIEEDVEEELAHKSEDNNYDKEFVEIFAYWKGVCCNICLVNVNLMYGNAQWFSIWSVYS